MSGAVIVIDGLEQLSQPEQPDISAHGLAGGTPCLRLFPQTDLFYHLHDDFPDRFRKFRPVWSVEPISGGRDQILSGLR